MERAVSRRAISLAAHSSTIQNAVSIDRRTAKSGTKGVRSMFSADDFTVSFADWPKNGPDPDQTAPLRREWFGCDGQIGQLI